MAACSLCKRVSLLSVDLDVYGGDGVAAVAVMATVDLVMARMMVDVVTVLEAWISACLRVCAVSHGPVQRMTAK